jgi:hypothetical protein
MVRDAQVAALFQPEDRLLGRVVQDVHPELIAGG